MAGVDDQEDDYLSMSFGDAPARANETSLQRTGRLKRTATERGRVPSKKERAEQQQKERDAALATQLDSSNKGAKMMAKMGFKGGALGKSEDARTEPIELLMKHDRGGIGVDREKKRKIREAAAEIKAQTKWQKVDEAEYRQRTRTEREEKRAKGMMWSAMRTLEGFETGDVHQIAGDDEEAAQLARESRQNSESKKAPPLHSVNILWRSLLKQRLERDRERFMRQELARSSFRGATYDDRDEDDDDRLATGMQMEALDEEDPELGEFEALSTVERLGKIVKELREKYHYCFWCKYRYASDEMDGCPGLTEDEHG